MKATSKKTARILISLGSAISCVFAATAFGGSAVLSNLQKSSPMTLSPRPPTIVTATAATSTIPASAPVLLFQTTYSGASTNAPSGSVNAAGINWPSGLASYSSGGTQQFFVADRFNARILVFNGGAPTSGQAPSYVIGQAGFTTAYSNAPAGCGSSGGTPSAYGLVSPMGLTVQSTYLWVADMGGNRVLRYSLPITANCTAANLEWGHSGSFTSSTTGLTNLTLNAPASVEWDGGHFYIIDFGNNRVLIFNSAITVGTQVANRVLGQADMTHSVKPDLSTIFPSAQRFGNTTCAPFGLRVINSKLVLADTCNSRVLIWNGVSGTAPTTFSNADAVLGQANMTSYLDNQGGSASASTMNKPADVVGDGRGGLYVSDKRNYRVLYFSSVPSSGTAAATAVLGQADFSSVSDNRGNATPVWNGYHLPVCMTYAFDKLWIAEEGYRVISWP